MLQREDVVVRGTRRKRRTVNRRSAEGYSGSCRVGGMQIGRKMRGGQRHARIMESSGRFKAVADRGKTRLCGSRDRRQLPFAEGGACMVPDTPFGNRRNGAQKHKEQHEQQILNTDQHAANGVSRREDTLFRRKKHISGLKKYIRHARKSPFCTGIGRTFPAAGLRKSALNNDLKGKSGDFPDYFS